MLRNKSYLNGISGLLPIGVIVLQFTVPNSTSAQPQQKLSDNFTTTESVASKRVISKDKVFKGKMPSMKSFGLAMPDIPPIPDNILDQTGKTIFGKEPFTLTVAENVGEIVYNFDADSKKLSSLDAKRGVSFSTRGTTLTCDIFHYDTTSQTIICKGEPARFASGLGLQIKNPMTLSTTSPLGLKLGQTNSYIAEADDISLNLESGLLILNRKAMITQIDDSGSLTQTAGEKITLNKVFAEPRIE